MKIEPGIFKAYDIRGLVEKDLSAELAFQIGRALVEYLKATSLAVGRDMRESSPALARALAEGAVSGGARVVDVGRITTDMLYFAVPSLSLDGGAMVTASHNPKEWNGFKLVREGSLALSGDAGIKEIKEWLLAERSFDRRSGGSLESKNVLSDYVRHVRRFVDADELRPFKVVMDGANGMAGAVAPAVFEGLPFERIELFFEPDGNFPHHEPNPLLPENRRTVIEAVKHHQADLGVAWDGDADRCFFVDDQGEFVPGDFVTALLGEMFLLKAPGATVVYDVRASWCVRDTTSALGGRALLNRVGHAFFKKRMREEGAIFGGEVSGHYYFRDNFFADNGMIPALLILELMSRKRQKLSEILAPLRRKYFISGEINSTVTDVERVLQELEERYGHAKISKLDGLSVDFEDWHFNVRPSNTEALLRLNLETLKESTLEPRTAEVLRVIRAPIAR